MSASKGRRKYRRKRYSQAGVYAMLFLLAALVLLWAALFVPILYPSFSFSIGGGLGIMVLVLSACGISCARRGVRETDRLHANSVIGLIGCILTFVVSLAIYLGGL